MTLLRTAIHPLIVPDLVDDCPAAVGRVRPGGCLIETRSSTTDEWRRSVVLRQSSLYITQCVGLFLVSSCYKDGSRFSHSGV